MLSQGGECVGNGSKNNVKNNVIELKIINNVRPLTQHERSRLEKLLYTWRDLIDHGKTDEATRLLPALIRCEDEREDLHLMFLYNLFCARYYRALGETENFKEVMSFLSGWQHKFLDEHNYYYYRLIAFSEHEAWRYKLALEAYYAAEESDPMHEWSDVGFYYSFGCCLSDMGYTHKAISYFEKALEKADVSNNHRYDVFIKGFLAHDYSKVGQGEEAVELLQNCIININNNDVNRIALGWLYYSFGVVFNNLERHNDAIRNFDEALQYYMENNKNYVNALYCKALALAASNRIEECIGCIDSALSLLTDEMDWEAIRAILLNTLKHSLTLCNPDSMQYMKTTAIPKLLEFGQYSEAVDYSKKISGFYEEIGDTARALEYSRLISGIYEKYINERVEGAV